VQVASKVLNLHSKFVHARCLGSQIIRYLRNGRAGRLLEFFAMYATDGQTDGQTKAMLITLFPTVGGIIRGRRMSGDENGVSVRTIIQKLLQISAFCLVVA